MFILSENDNSDTLLCHNILSVCILQKAGRCAIILPNTRREAGGCSIRGFPGRNKGKEKPQPMKIAFSTLGCPDFSWSDIYSVAKDFGFDGIEIRGIGKEISAVKARPFIDGQIDRTIATLERLGLEIPCLTSG